MLALLYQNPEKWSFAFQSTVQLSRLNIILQPTDASVKMIERSLQNNRYYLNFPLVALGQASLTQHINMADSASLKLVKKWGPYLLQSMQSSLNGMNG